MIVDLSFRYSLICLMMTSVGGLRISEGIASRPYYRSCRTSRWFVYGVHVVGKVGHLGCRGHWDVWERSKSTESSIR